MDNFNVNGVNGFVNALGSLAESMTIFYKACLDSGASAETADRLTAIYMREMLYGAAQLPEEESE